MLSGDLVIHLVEIERDPIVGFDDEKGSEANGFRPAENLGEESGRALLIGHETIVWSSCTVIESSSSLGCAPSLAGKTATENPRGRLGTPDSTGV